MTDTTDRAHRMFRFERQLDASPDEVFDAWTTPEQVTAWWDPSGAPLVACTIDLRVAGGFRFVSSGHAPPFEGTYELVERPHRLEFRAMGARGVIALAAHGAGTHMVVTIESPSEEHFETFLRLGVATGTSTTLDNLVRVVRRAGRAAAG